MGGIGGSGAGSSRSSSNSSTTSTAVQETVTTSGASGDMSPTINARGDVTYNPPEISLAALSGMAEATRETLAVLSDSLGAQARTTASQSDQGNALLSAVLAQNSKLAENVQSGGAASAQKLTTYAVLGVLAIAGLFLFFRR